MITFQFKSELRSEVIKRYREHYAECPDFAYAMQNPSVKAMITKCLGVDITQPEPTVQPESTAQPQTTNLNPKS